MRIFYLVLVEVFVAVLCAAPDAEDIFQIIDQTGGSCTKDQITGTCESLQNCPSLKIYEKQGRLEEFYKCGYKISVGLIYCCPPDYNVIIRSLNETVKNARHHAQKECLNFEERSPSAEFHIIGGERSDVSEFPHVVAIGHLDLDNEIKFHCGGTLISDQFVLTAAHCCNNKKQQPQLVRLGRTSIDLSDSNDRSQKLDAIIKTIYFPNEYSLKQKVNDIALIKLENKVHFSDNIFPACLSTDETIQNNLSIVGWGISNTENTTRSNWLLKANIQELNLLDCQKLYEPVIDASSVKLSITDNHFCGIGNNKSRISDTCQGDSGGPITFQIRRKYYIHGITSYGFGCGGGSFPSVYTRVSKYLDWITKIVWPLK